MKLQYACLSACLTAAKAAQVGIDLSHYLAAGDSDHEFGATEAKLGFETDTDLPVSEDYDLIYDKQAHDDEEGEETSSSGDGSGQDAESSAEDFAFRRGGGRGSVKGTVRGQIYCSYVPSHAELLEEHLMPYGKDFNDEFLYRDTFKVKRNFKVKYELREDLMIPFMGDKAVKVQVDFQHMGLVFVPEVKDPDNGDLDLYF